MKAIVIAGAVLAIGSAVSAYAGDPLPKPKIPPPDVTVKIQAPEGTSEQDIATGIAAENARRDPAAREASRAAKQKDAEDAARQQRVSKICDSIPEKSLADDPSLRRMCGE